MFSIVTVLAIRETLSLPKTLKTLLLSLAVSDVGVGLLVQPFYTSVLVKGIQQNNPGCITYEVFDIIASIFSTASFFGVVAVSEDRFLAIHLHLRYQELVTRKRVVALVILIWMISVFLSLLTLCVPLDVKAFFYIQSWFSICPCYNTGLYQSLFNCTTPQESESGPARTTSSADWRNGKFCYPC